MTVRERLETIYLAVLGSTLLGLCAWFCCIAVGEQDRFMFVGYCAMALMLLVASLLCWWVAIVPSKKQAPQ